MTCDVKNVVKPNTILLLGVGLYPLSVLCLAESLDILLTTNSGRLFLVHLSSVLVNSEWLPYRDPTYGHVEVVGM